MRLQPLLTTVQCPPRRSWHRCAALCLGESLAQARLKCLWSTCESRVWWSWPLGLRGPELCQKCEKRRNWNWWNHLWEGPPEPGGGHVWALHGLVPMSLLYGRSPNCTCVQLPGSGCQTGSLPPGCPEATTWGGVAGLDPLPGDSSWGQPAWLCRCFHPAGGCNASRLWTSEVAGPSLWSGLLWRPGDGKPSTKREEDGRPVCGGIPGEIHPDRTPFFNTNEDWLWEICQADAYIPGSSGDGLSQTKNMRHTA